MEKKVGDSNLIFEQKLKKSSNTLRKFSFLVKPLQSLIDCFVIIVKHGLQGGILSYLLLVIVDINFLEI